MGREQNQDFEDPPLFLQKNIQFGPCKKKSKGGSSMRAVLGPVSAGDRRSGSKPKKGHCAVTSELNDAVGQHALSPTGGSWVSSYLLGRELGGDGVAENLVPSTEDADAQLRAVEEALEEILSEAAKYHQDHPDDRYWYGVDYSVSTRGDLGSRGEDFSGVPETIQVSLQPARRLKVGPNEAPSKVETGFSGSNDFCRAFDGLLRDLERGKFS